MGMPLRVLILEDRPTDIDLLLDELDAAGYDLQWECVATEADFVRRLDASLDIILADYTLPQFDALRALHHLQERGLDIPFIVVTGSVSEEVAVQCIQAGAADYLLKDRLGRLGPAVVRALAEKHTRDARREAEVALRASEERFRLLAEHARDIIYRLRLAPTRYYEYISPACTGITGFTPDEYYANPDLGVQIVHPDDRPTVEAARRAPQANAEPLTYRCIRKNGGMIWLEEYYTPIHDHTGACVVVDAVVRDITDRKQAEDARAQLRAREEAARLKDEFISLVSHELRTPLASLVGFSELLLIREHSEEERREYLGVMLKEGRRLTALINDFLDLQRMESGREAVALETVDLRAILEPAVAAVGPDAARPIVVDLPAALPPVLADRDRIHQVLVNLLSNARKYSPDGGTIRVTARALADDLEVAVQDQGLGIPPEALPRMFEKFYRVGTLDRRHIQGTGLGLAITRHIVEGHGGRIWVESPGLGQGSTFRFTLPLVRSGAAPAPPEAVPPRGDVLVVEASVTHAHGLASTLRGAGYEVRSAVSAEEALYAIGQGRPACVVVGLRLDGPLDGWDLLSVLRSRRETHTLPVVVVAAGEPSEQVLALGIQDYLLKPVSRERLVATVRQFGVNPSRRILVVDDSPDSQQLVLRYLHADGLPAEAVGSGEEALAALDAAPAAYALVVLDLGLPGMDGFAVLEAIRGRAALDGLPVVIFTGRDLTPTDKRYLSERAATLVRKGNGVPITAAVQRALRDPACCPDR